MTGSTKKYPGAAAAALPRIYFLKPPKVALDYFPITRADWAKIYFRIAFEHISAHCEQSVRSTQRVEKILRQLRTVLNFEAGNSPPLHKRSHSTSYLTFSLKHSLKIKIISISVKFKFSLFRTLYYKSRQNQ